MYILKKIFYLLCFYFFSFNISAVIPDNEQESISYCVKSQFTNEDYNIFKYDNRTCILNNINMENTSETALTYLKKCLENIDFDELTCEQQETYNKFAKFYNSLKVKR